MFKTIRKKVLAITLTLATLVAASQVAVSTTQVEAASKTTYTNAAQVCNLVYKGYNGGTYGPITVTQGYLIKGSSYKYVYVITLSGTESVSNQTTGYLTDALAGFNLSNKYLTNVVKVITNNIPSGSNLVLAGHSLGGMVAQQVAANSTVKSKYNVLNTVTFGSPLLSAGSREGTIKRLGDTSDVVPYLSGSTINNTAWAIAGLQRENGGYGTDVYNAHVKSYLRSDVWGKYDAVGVKNGSYKLVLYTNTMTYYKSSTTVTS